MTTLDAALAARGMTHAPAGPGRRAVYDFDGRHMGDLTAGEAWAMLRRRAVERHSGRVAALSGPDALRGWLRWRMRDGVAVAWEYYERDER